MIIIAVTSAISERCFQPNSRKARSTWAACAADSFIHDSARVDPGALNHPARQEPRRAPLPRPFADIAHGRRGDLGAGRSDVSAGSKLSQARGGQSYLEYADFQCSLANVNRTSGAAEIQKSQPDEPSLIQPTVAIAARKETFALDSAYVSKSATAARRRLAQAGFRLAMVE
jgi:hypothetical protein